MIGGSALAAATSASRSKASSAVAGAASAMAAAMSAAIDAPAVLMHCVCILLSSHARRAGHFT